jgi:hypothetical protein
MPGAPWLGRAACWLRNHFGEACAQIGAPGDRAHADLSLGAGCASLLGAPKMARKTKQLRAKHGA